MKWTNGSLGLLEIKCPFAAYERDLTPEEACELPIFCAALGMNDRPELCKEHPCYHQVQGQLAISGLAWCDFVLWTGPMRMSVQRILLTITYGMGDWKESSSRSGFNMWKSEPSCRNGHAQWTCPCTCASHTVVRTQAFDMSLFFLAMGSAFSSTPFSHFWFYWRECELHILHHNTDKCTYFCLCKLTLHPIWIFFLFFL